MAGVVVYQIIGKTYPWWTNNGDHNGWGLHGSAVDKRHMESGLIPVQVAASLLLSSSS